MKRLVFAAIAGSVVLAFAAGCGGEESVGEPPAPPPPASSEPPAATEPASTEGETAPQDPAPPEDAPPRGGVYRIGVESSFNFTNGFDPTGEYLNVAFLIYNGLLLRPLLNYTHQAGPEGNVLVPDLASDLPEVSEDGLTYTFRLRDGVRFGPPVNREITSRDVAYAFERIGTPDLVAQYGFYYTVIEGMAEFSEGMTDTISGIETPDDKTIVFHLVAPAGDFPYRVAMPATAPIPEEVAGCFTKAGEYGRYVIASGAYMLERSEDLDITSCDTLSPIAGFDPDTKLVLVRNPSYDPATGVPETEGNFVDRFEFLINSNRDDIFAKIQAGDYEGEISSTPPQVLREYSESEELQDRLHLDPIDATWYVSMNLTVPPFDDIHVRRAVNLVMDKDGLRRAWGGPLRGEIATHIVPDSMLNDVLADYDPYPSPESAGDEEAAREEMRQSKYDSDGDGLCDAPECKDVVLVHGAEQFQQDMEPIVVESLRKIGIEPRPRTFEDAYTTIQTVGRNVPITSQPGWIKDYPDASTFMILFDSRSTLSTGNVNYSLVGITPEQAAGLDGFAGNADGVPNVDADIDACNVLTGDERVQCWADLDRKLMEEVVPWVPYLVETHADIVSDAVVAYEFDQFMGEAALVRVAVDASRQ
jgi:peptide/nickel transport system substrate-binding protein